MNRLFLDFEQARAKHLRFKSKLRSILYGMEIDETPVASHTECMVGKWIYDHALAEYGHIPEMTELEKVHMEIHSVARELLAEYKKGNVEEARAGLVKIETVADALVALLSTVEQKIIAEAGPVDEADRLAMTASIRELADLSKANEELDRIIRNQSGKLSAERKTLYDVLMRLPATIAILRGPDHVFEMANPPFLAGFDGQEIIGKTVREVLPSLEGQGFFELVNQVYQSGEPFTGNEMRIQVTLEDGSPVEAYINLNYQALRDASGQIDGVISFSYNVTEAVVARKKAEENEERFRFMANAMPVQTWTANKEGILQYANERWDEYFGKAAGSGIDSGWQAIVHRDDLPVVREKWQEAGLSNSPFETELRLKNREGQYRWHLVRANPFLSSDGTLTWYGTNTDIHEMKLLQEQIKQSYEDLEVKVKFRNIDLERTIRDLQREVESLRAAVK